MSGTRVASIRVKKAAKPSSLLKKGFNGHSERGEESAFRKTSRKKQIPIASASLEWHSSTFFNKLLVSCNSGS